MENIFGWLGVLLSLTGFYANVKKSKWGFALWFVADIIFIITSIINQTWYFVVQYAVYAILAIWGYWQWAKK